MASGSYNAYKYPYQQSSAQQYSQYQTAPAPNNVSQQPRQYQSAPPVAAQSTDYMSYQAQPYNQESGYGGRQDNSWGGNQYGSNRETTSRAAEVLHNMSNVAYTPNNTTTASQPGFTATNAGATRYSTTPQAQQSHLPPQSHNVHSYEQSQPRPRSINTNKSQVASQKRGLPSPAMAAGYPSQRAAGYSQQQQHSASPAQSQYSHSHTTPASSARSTAMTAAAQYHDYNNRQLPNLDMTRGSNTTVSTPYSYGDAQSTAAAVPTIVNNAPEMYHQSTTTVDPSAVYDPWPEYQRKQEAIRAQKAIEDAARAEEERRAEQIRKEDESKRKAEEDRAREAEMEQSKQARRKSQPSSAVGVGSALTNVAPDSTGGDGTEAEIRALMAKMRELNNKDPALLARIWEEERRAKAPNKSPTVQAKAAPQPTTTIQTSQSSRPQAANQRKKAVPKEPPTPSAVRPATPVAQPVARTPAPAVPSTSRSGGNTIWPPEKKAQLATAASTYLNTHNSSRHLDASEILRMLDGNPSYIELCEQLESMELKLDRAAFAKTLLTAVPDVNSASQSKSAQAPAPSPVSAITPSQVLVAPLAIMKREAGTPATPAARPASTAPSPAYSAFPEDNVSAPTPIPVAEMVPIKPEFKKPASKEEAARKRDINDLIDLTQLPEDEVFEPAPKRVNSGSTYSYASPRPNADDALRVDDGSSTNFPVRAHVPQPAQQYLPPPINELRNATIVELLDRKKALRRNTYNIKTIARDVLLACGRHSETRQLNQHLEILRSTLPQVSNESDLSTLRWDLIDPGVPPRGYFKDGVQGLAEDADDEEESEDEESKQPRQRLSTIDNGTEGSSTSQQKAQAPPLEPTNPFKQPKRRGRPPRHSYPENTTTPSTPKQSASKDMSASAPRPSATGVGYSTFRSATDSDGKPSPKKRGRPVGWRKHIHGSAAAQVQTNPTKQLASQKFVPTQPSSLRKVENGQTEPIRIESRSHSVANTMRPFVSFKCKWQGCKAELHNLDTLKKHVHKVHRNGTPRGTLECLWADCGTEVTSHDTIRNIRIERREHKSFGSEIEWHHHLEQAHLSPISWGLGDGPASGLSGNWTSCSICTLADVNRLSRCNRFRSLS